MVEDAEKPTVVDNASADGSAELVGESSPAVRLVASHEILGFGRAAPAARRSTVEGYR